MMAEAEVGLISGENAPPTVMAQTGWYLHGVGSALASLQLYGIERQRQAFAISAHIFDLLLLAIEDLEFHERLQYVFAAQIAFLRSDADPNAIAVRRRQIPPPSGLELITSSSTTALELGTALLSVDVESLYRELSGLEAQRSRFERQLEVATTDTIYAAQSGVIDGVRGLLNSLIRGEQRSLEAATQALLQAIRAPSSQADITSRWVAAHLFRIAGDLRATSIWLQFSLRPWVPRSDGRSAWPHPVSSLCGHPSSNCSVPARPVRHSMPTCDGHSYPSPPAPERLFCRNSSSSVTSRVPTLESASWLPPGAWYEK